MVYIPDEFAKACSLIFEENIRRRQRPLRDYFSWGRDNRHINDDSEDEKFNSKHKILGRFKNYIKTRLEYSIAVIRKYLGMEFAIPKKYRDFGFAYSLMSDESSRRLFCELILIRIFGENRIKLSSFDESFVKEYEKASAEVIASSESLNVYKWILKKVFLKESGFGIFTVPTTLNLINNNRLYEYQGSQKGIQVEPGDIVIDAGVGWGDTTIALANRCHDGGFGHLYAFDILDDAFLALEEQIDLNPTLRCITPIKKALFDEDSKVLFTSDPSPAARIVEHETAYEVRTITIDTFVEQHDLKAVDFIKMDIEGAEAYALRGARQTIQNFKPKLALSVYHIWSDLRVITELVNSIRDDYQFYLDCTTGFGGEAILYCR